ncbi:MAG: NADH-quinone oxidoreductase subunit M [Burkholderiales bacterium]|jgi:NADH-quinone oxidoreductase subunit M|nr:NADH-quinone oxidoreductase subunit M [Burkholderiales bacterium]
MSGEMNVPVLSLLIWLPIIAGVAVLLFRDINGGRPSRWLANLAAWLAFFIAAYVLCRFQSASAAMQFSERAMWIPYFGIEYALGIDGLSALFIGMNALITLLVIAAQKADSKGSYLAALLITSGLTYGAFSARDAVLFYIFFEAMLIPMYLAIGVFGGSQRKYATTKFFLYTLFGSLFMLLALFYLYGVSQTFSLQAWHHLPLSLYTQLVLFGAFFMAFAVKTPMWPLHAWAPDAYVEAPTGAAIMLASTKIGAYGFLRLLLPIVPDAAQVLAPWMIGLSLLAVIYFGFVALAQTDLRRLIAYSSIAHMGLVTLGLFLFSAVALKGAVLLMVSNGLVVAALFFCADALKTRMGDCRLTDCGGIVNAMPWLATLLVFFAMANIGLPGTSGFVGEFLVILGAVGYQLGVGLLTATVVVIGAAYTLWMVRRVVFGPVTHPSVSALADLGIQERLLLSVLAAVMLGFGLWPQALLGMADASITQLLAHMALSKL